MIPEGIDVALVKELKEKNRERISKYVETRKGATYYDKESVWDSKQRMILRYHVQHKMKSTKSKPLF